MRLHIEVDDTLIAEIDKLAGPRQRSQFVRDALQGAVEQRRRWEHIRRARGVIADSGHEWDDDPAGWVRAQRFSDSRFVG